MVDVLERLHMVCVDEALKLNSESQFRTYEKDGQHSNREALKKQSSNVSVGDDIIDAFEKGLDGEKDDADPFLVDFQGADDADHPHNWSTFKKALVMFEIMLLTCVTYMGSSIYTPGQEEIQREFGIGHVVGTLNLSMYVLGYGIGPIIFAPLSEFATIGRQQLYIATLFLFSMLQIGCALVQNIAGLVILRFFAGILCSPSLATGGASIGDIMRPNLVPIFMGLWSVGAVAAPVVGPPLGASMVIAKNWRWIFWLLMWMSAFTWVLLVFFFSRNQRR